MTDAQLHILQHALGCDKYGQTRYRGRDEGDGCGVYHRNRYYVPPFGYTAPLEALVAAGFMEKAQIELSGTLYIVTLDGIAAMKAWSPKPPRPPRAPRPPEGRRIRRRQLMKVLDRTFKEYRVELTVRDYNKILTDLGFRLGNYTKAAKANPT